MSRFRPSLTREQLHDIGKRRDAQDVPRLLWEIARLRAVALRADQLIRSADTSGSVAAALRAELDELACIEEAKAERAQFWGRDL